MIFCSMFCSELALNSALSSFTSSKYGLKTNDSLKVEYIKSKPSDSRIKNLGDYKNQYYVFLFSCIENLGSYLV